MKTRREARECAVQILYQQDMNPRKLDDVLEDFWATQTDVDKPIRAFADSLVRGVAEKREVVDEIIREHAHNWDIKRMGVVDRNVLRMAVYELMEMPTIPAAVTINEAVDIAKFFCNADAGKFMNGILDRIRKVLGRSAGKA